jgi:transcriptional regulator with XRE-family HTH domain
MSLGETLRLAREEKGQTVSQVAEATRMMVQIVEDLEREDFRRIAAPIYGRGFIKLYAEHLGLDAEPLIREFMEIYTGSRPPQVVRRTEVPLDSGSVERLNSEAVAPSDCPTARPPDRSTVPPSDRPTVPPSGEPDLFSVAAGRSEAVRSVADPAAQPGGAAPPRVRPAASAPVEVRSPASGESTFRRAPAKLREAGRADAPQPGRGGAGGWLSAHGTPAAIVVVAAVVLLLLTGVFVLRHKASKAHPAKPASIKVQRVLPPAKPYFE